MIVKVGIFTITIGCDHDTDDMEPDHNGDMACRDCRTTWAENDHRRY